MRAKEIHNPHYVCGRGAHCVPGVDEQSISAASSNLERLNEGLILMMTGGDSFLQAMYDSTCALLGPFSA